MQKFGKINNTQIGLVVDYAALPGAVPRLILPFFGIPIISDRWMHAMEESSKFYSKGGRESEKIFIEDSKQKEEKASVEVRKAADGLLQRSFEQLTALATATVPQLVYKLGHLSSSHNKFKFAIMTTRIEAIWSILSEMPGSVAHK